jgi:hypothetical protein
MKSHDFFAVIYKGEVLCTGCLPEGVTVQDEDVTQIFANSEHDRYPVCDKCNTEHDYVCLTEYGMIHTSDHDLVFRDVTIFRYAGQVYFCQYQKHPYEHPEIITREQVEDYFSELTDIDSTWASDMLDNYLLERYGVV